MSWQPGTPGAILLGLAAISRGRSMGPRSRRPFRPIAAFLGGALLGAVPRLRPSAGSGLSGLASIVFGLLALRTGERTVVG